MYALIFISISIFIAYNFYTYYSIKRKSFIVKNKRRDGYDYIIDHKNIKNYFKIVSNDLNNLGNPYGLNIKKYIIIKYFISIALFIIMYVNSRNLLTSIILFLIFFSLPNILVFMHRKSESILIVEDISNIVQNVILSLSANMSLYDSLKSSINTINYGRLKEEYSKFIENYMLYNFNLYKAISIFSNKFSSFEFDMFLSLLSQGEKEGNIIEILDTFSNSLEFQYFKNLKYKSSQRTIGIIFVTIIVLINSFVIVLYPIINEISTSFTNLFR